MSFFVEVKGVLPHTAVVTFSFEGDGTVSVEVERKGELFDFLCAGVSEEAFFAAVRECAGNRGMKLVPKDD
jgi:hypothetical protein